MTCWGSGRMRHKLICWESWGKLGKEDLALESDQCPHPIKVRVSLRLTLGPCKSFHPIPSGDVFVPPPPLLPELLGDSVLSCKALPSTAVS